ncbi:MAG: RagB/SusD family nutrient uptake outer membrane protein [Muribaculaceae bacterium]|nr:RagB/SusD family nutrient uptake outer membrane protein [Muribaculaceae bacterium]
MKKNIFVKGAVTLMVAAGLSSCASDYLERAPISYEDENRINSSTETAQKAAWGVCRSMYFGYNIASRIQFMNGEPWINTMYGEVYAQDAYYTLWQDFSKDFMDGRYLLQTNYWMTWMPWMYSYNLIAQSNKILDAIDKAEGPQADREYIKAQLLTIRSHAYTKLLQFYAPRWEDSNNGETLCICLRETYSTGNEPLSSMNTIHTVVNRDLDEAIRLFDKCGKNRTKIYEPDASIAHGIKARLALIFHDWDTALEHATLARQDYPIMSSDEYLAGFNTPNDEWMWSNALELEDQYLGTITWGGQYACNGGYVYSWGYGAGAINIDLYNQMDPNDTRRALYWTPDKKLPVILKPAYFWNPAYTDELTMNMNVKTGNGSPTGMAIQLKKFANEALPARGISYFQVQAYRNSGDPEGELVGIVPFGAQFKFWGAGPFSGTSFPFMRASEMAFIEAEAACHKNLEDRARKALEEVNGNRIPGYTCTKSGDDLLEEVYLSRRIELWGEGFAWTDLKRLNRPSVRRAWKANDPTSGNIPPAFAGTVLPSDINGWRISLPDAEVNYNSLIQKYSH